MNIQAKVAMDKEKHPERYCPTNNCLWKTAKLNHATQQHEGGGYCPRHAPDPPRPDVTNPLDPAYYHYYDDTIQQPESEDEDNANT